MYVCFLFFLKDYTIVATSVYIVQCNEAAPGKQRGINYRFKNQLTPTVVQRSGQKFENYVSISI